MAANVLENLARWNLQIALLAVVAAGLVPLLRINAPVIRHTFWRSVVAACLLLPLVQPWRSAVIDSSMLRIEALDAATATDLVSRRIVRRSAIAARPFVAARARELDLLRRRGPGLSASRCAWPGW